MLSEGLVGCSGPSMSKGSGRAACDWCNRRCIIIRAACMLGINDYEPVAARHHVAQPGHPGYMPATSLAVSRPFLATHPRVQLYTFSQIASQDPQAHERRLAQESGLDEWREFVHLAFWHEGVAASRIQHSAQRAHSRFSADELGFLEQIYPAIATPACIVCARWSRSASRMFAYEQALSRSGSPVILTDARGNVLFGTSDGPSTLRALGASARCAAGCRPSYPATCCQSIKTQRSIDSSEPAQTLTHPVDAELSNHHRCQLVRYRRADRAVLSLAVFGSRRTFSFARSRQQNFGPAFSPANARWRCWSPAVCATNRSRNACRVRDETIESQLNTIFGKLRAWFAARSW